MKIIDTSLVLSAQWPYGFVLNVVFYKNYQLLGTLVKNKFFIKKMVTHYQIRRHIPFPSAIEYALNYIPQSKNERGISIANQKDIYAILNKFFV